MLSVVVLLAGCGGGGGGGGGTAPFPPEPARLAPGAGVNGGLVTGKGSIIGNGVQFDNGTPAPGFRFGLGDAAGTEAGVKPGMIAMVRGAFTSIDTLGTYDNVIVEPQVIGAVEGLSGNNFTVLAQAVTMTSFTIFDNVTRATLANNDIVEVHGFFSGANAIEATHIRRIAAGETRRQVRGVVSALDNAARTLSIGAQPVNFASLAPPAGLAVGKFVEVEGSRPGGPGTALVATKVEVDDLSFEADKEIEIEGRVESHDAGAKSFVLRSPNGLVTCRYDVAGFFTPTRFELEERNTVSDAATVLAPGGQVEVEGRLVGGTLQAREVELRRSENVVLEGDVSGGTLFGLSLSPALGAFGVSNGDHVEVGGNVVPGATPITVNVTRVDRLPASARRLIQGPVTAHGDGFLDRTITILGIRFDTTGLQERDDQTLGPSEFQNAANRRVTIEQFFGNLVDLVSVVKGSAQDTNPLDPVFTPGTPPVFRPRSGVEMESHR